MPELLLEFFCEEIPARMQQRASADLERIMNERLLAAGFMFAYGQVESPYGSGQFIKDLREHFSKDERVVTSEIRDKDAIVGSIKEFLGRGN